MRIRLRAYRYAFFAVALLLVLSGVSSANAAANDYGNFVTRTGTQLSLHGEPFRFSGTNMYWLGLSESGSVHYPSQFEVDNGFATAQEMGATVVRSHTLGDTVGCPDCIEPSEGVFNQTALQHIDYAIKSARDHGIRLVIPLVDNWHYYEGGKHTYTDWLGLSSENDFYTDSATIAAFEQHISVLLNHVNVYTGVAYKDDPTILAWEEGNELTNAPSSWVSTVATYIKSLDTNHLVAFGTPNGVQSNTLSVPNLDIEDYHTYPANIAGMNQDASTTEQAGKAFYVGEFDWTSGDSLQSFVSAIETNGSVGDTFWSLFPLDPTSGYVQHGDGYTLHYPGDTDNMRIRAQILRTHAYRMSERPLPPHARPGRPDITSITGQQIAWRGAAFGDIYSIERSLISANGPWTTICDLCVTDNGSPWTDTTQQEGTNWYRIQAFNVDGVASAYSNVTSVVAPGPPVVVDDLNDWTKSFDHSANVSFDHSNAQNFDGDTSRADRHIADNEWIVWRKPNMTQFEAVTYFWQGEPVSPFSLYVSADDSTWTAVTPTITSGPPPVNNMVWLQYTYSLNNLTNVSFVKVVWNNTTGMSWSPQISQVTLTS